MSVTSKTSSLQSYHMLLYRHALHPEFFRIDGRQRVQHGDYEYEAWIFRGGHVLRFEHNGLCVSEVVTPEPEPLPERGLVTTLPCAGERDHESEFAERIVFMTSMQTETLTDHLYLSTYNELLEHGRNQHALLTLWHEGDGKANLSLIEGQRRSHEMHIQCYHLRADCGLVLRTQTIFELKDGSAED
ncbi:MAG: hypothetical protein ACYTGG_10430 [Planctomycetota bacterium]